MDVRNILMSTSSSFIGVGLNWVLHLFKRSYCFCTKEMYLSSVRAWPPTRLTWFFQKNSKSRIPFWISVGRLIFNIYWLCTTHNRPPPISLCFFTIQEENETSMLSGTSPKKTTAHCPLTMSAKSSICAWRFARNSQRAEFLTNPWEPNIENHVWPHWRSAYF